MSRDKVTFQSYSDARVPAINRYLKETILQTSSLVSARFTPLLDAMEYSLFGEGKRLRPLLMCASADYVGIPFEKILPAACAIEYIHTYSLVHDDLPAMDNDDFRRGKPSSHKKYGEATAILAGDALLTEAFARIFYLLPHFPHERVLKAAQVLGSYAGVGGLVGGQFLDISVDHTNMTLPELEFIHIHKTGALILSSVLMPGILSGADEKRVKQLRRYGEAIGLAFQISDDVLDSDPHQRYSRGPRSKPRASYSQFMGLSESRERLAQLIRTGIDALESAGGSGEPLIAIAEFIGTRKA